MAGFLQGLSDFFLGPKASVQTASTTTNQQQGLQNESIQQLLQLLKGGGNSQSFAPIAQQARTQFNTQTIPSLAERFTAMGGGQNSSAFQGALGSAGAGLEQNLAAQGSQHNNQLMQLLGSLSGQPQFENIAFPGQPGALHGLFEALGKALGVGITGGFGG